MIRFAVVFSLFWIFASIAQANDTRQVWRAELSCGNYDSVTESGVRFDRSRYTLVIGKAQDQSGLKRSLTLYENNNSGSFEVAEGANCQASGPNLQCSLGPVQVLLSLANSPRVIAYEYGKIYVFPALITTRGKIFGSSTARGDCQVRD